MTVRLCPLFAAILLSAVACVLIVSNVAVASSVTDPRKCDYGPTRKADCARNAALTVARNVLSKRVGLQYPWQGPLTCTSAGSMLRWRCAFAQRYPQLPPRGYVAVTYKATSAGWRVYSSIVATP